MNAEIEILANRVLSALGNGLYQGLLLTVLVALVFRWFRGISATTRHAVGMMTLVLVGLLPAFHFLLPHPRPAPATQPPSVPQWTDREEDANGVTAAVSEDPVNARSTASEPIEERGDDETGTRAQPRFVADWHPTTEHGGVDSRWLVLEPVEDAEAGVSVDLDQESARMGVAEVAEVSPGFDLRTAKGLGAANQVRPVVPAASRWLRIGPSGWKYWESLGRRWFEPMAWRPTLPSGWSVVLVAVWAGIAVIGGLRIALQCLALRRVKRHAVPASAPLQRRFRELCLEAAVRRPVRLGITPAMGSPVAAGFLRPYILLPEEIAANSTDAEVVPLLRHELAHLKRRDDWSNLVQLAIRAVFFFHPGVLWLSRRLAIDREIACDDHVLAATRRPREYALFLTDFAGRSLGRSWAVAPAAWSKQSQLTERIDMILDTHRNASPTVARAKVCTLGAMAALTAALGLYAGPRVALAASEDGNSSGTTQITVSSDLDGTATATTTAGASASALATPSAKAKPAARSLIATDGKTVITSVSPDGTTTTLEAALPPVTPALPPQPPTTGPAPAALPQSTPMPPMPPTPASGRSKHAEHDDSLEARLERLEKMVESLAKRSSGVLLKEWKPELKEWKPDLKFEVTGPDEKQLREIARQAREAGERAGRDAARAAQEIAKLSQADGEHRKAQQERNVYIQRQARADVRRQEVKVEREVLEEQRRVLEKQIREMERQMERLSQKLEKIDEQVDAIHEREAEAREAEEAARVSEESKPGKGHSGIKVQVDTDTRVKLRDDEAAKEKEKEKDQDQEKDKVKF